ncbi:unnamed protein product [Polarella glacialis]|uniref:Uncharacterized protein n=1 Tax=Polarella glacialis TaxID=89957 RepID=A0A813HN87_POLGL|nr:unnamed protein product [Polarella glacialis]
MEAKFAGQRKESSVEVDRLAARTADLEEKLQRQRLSMEDAWRALSSESERQQLAGEMKIRELQEQVARQRDAGSRAAESFAGRSADFQFQLDHSIRQRSETTQQLQASEVKVLELTAQLGSQCGVDAKLQQALERKAAESEARNQALDEQLRRQHQLLLEGALEAAAAKAKLAAAEKLQAAGGLEAEQRAQASEARSKVVEDELLHQREQAAATAETTALRIAGLQKQVAEQRKAAEESRTARERSLQGLSGKMLELEGELERRDQSAEGASQRLAELETQLEQQTRAMADVKTESQGLLQKLEAEKQAAASLAQTEIAGLFQQVEEQKRAAEAANTQSEGTLQKLEEQQRAAEGAKTESEGLLQDSRTKVAEMEIQLSQALAAAAEAGGEAEQSAARRSEFQQRVQTAEGRSKELSELLTQQVDASTKVQAALEQKAVEVSELNLKAEQSAALRSDLEQRVQTAEGRSKDLSEQLAQQLEASTQVQAALEQKAAEASELNLKAQAAAAEQSAALRSGLEQRVQTAEGRSKDLSEQLAQQLEASTQVQAALEQKAAEASELNLKAQAAAASEAKLRDLLQEVQKRCGELEAQAAKEKAVADEAAEKARLETELRLQAGDSRTRELAAQLASLQAVLDAEKTMQETKSTMASETQDVAGKSDTSEVAASASQNTANSRLTRSEQPANARSLLGISVHQLTTTFLDEVLAAGFSRDASVYDIAEAVIRKPGEAATCPIDGGTGAAYVQLLSGEDSIGSATHMLSYSCASPIGDIADALQQHCQDSGLDLKRTYVWICSLCSNQHRACEREEVLSSAGEGPSAEQLRNEILARMRAIGRVLALLTPWDQPHYVQRTWCLAEMHLALSLGSSCDVAAVFPPGQTQRLADQLQGKTAEGCLANAWRVLSEMRPESSEATSPAAKAALLRLLGSSCGGFAAVEAGISRQLRTWLVTAAEGRLRRLLATGTAVDLSSVARACDQVGWLLREVALHHRATAMLQDGLQLLLRSSLVASNLGSKDSLAASQLGLLSSLGTAKGTCSSNQDELLRACLDARRGHERMGTLETAAGVELLCSIGSARWTSGDQERAAEAFQEALRIRRDTRSLESQEGAVLLRNIGVVRWAQGDHEGALEVFAEARRVRERTGSLAGAGGAALLLNIGFAKADQGDSTGALEAFEEAMRLVPAAPGDYGEGSPCTGATDLRDTLGGISAPGGIDDALLPQLLAATPSGATLLSSIGVAQGNRGDQAGALSVYRQARRVREQSGALASVAGAVLLRNTGVALAGMGDHQAALQAFVEAEKLREKTGTLATSAGANLLGSLGAARAECGDLPGALAACQQAKKVHARAGTLQTPGGRSVLKHLRNLEDQQQLQLQQRSRTDEG